VAQADAGFHLGVDEGAVVCREFPHRQGGRLFPVADLPAGGGPRMKALPKICIKRIGWLLVMTGALACPCLH
jgi:hypothetical protein